MAFTCIICNKSFCNNYGLNRHVARIHVKIKNINKKLCEREKARNGLNNNKDNLVPGEACAETDYSIKRM